MGAELGENRFSNRSGPKGDVNPGNRGKFNEAQTEERLKIHAIAIATGSPTYQQIVQHWHEKGIDISLQSEKEWRQANRTKIEKRKSDLIESGEISIPVVSEEVLSDSMMTLSLEASNLSRHLRLAALKLLKKVNLEASKDKEERLAQKEILDKFSVIVDKYNDTNAAIKDKLKTLFDFSSKIKIKDNKIQKLVDKKFNQRFIEHQEAEEDFVEDGEITDDIRSKFFKEIEKREKENQG